jgi:transcriptional regulator with XRE-family HTH domain
MATKASALLRRARTLRQMTQAELSSRSGISQPVISAYETGKRDPTASSLLVLLDALDCDLTVLPRVGNPRPGIGPSEWDVARSGPVEIERNGSVLPDLLLLADSIPRRRRGPLAYPRLRRMHMGRP